MTRIEYLLVCLMEECAEVSQAASKSLRFGLGDRYKDKDTPEKALAAEILDLIAVIGMLQAENVADSDATTYMEGLSRKRDKVEKYILYSQERGIVNKESGDVEFEE